MVLVLCIGDLHIPHRASDLPPRFKELLQPGKIHHVLCPGNLCCREILDYLKTVCGNIHLTKGDFDDLFAPENKILTIENFKIGVCHGHQVVPPGDVEALGVLLRRMDVDILITGHTHKFQVVQYEDRLLMNPGSATGAYSMFAEDVIPSFILMDVSGNKVDVYIYQLVDGESKVKKMEFVKPASRGGSTAKPTPPTASSPETANGTTNVPLDTPSKEETSNVPPPDANEPPAIETLGSGAPMGPKMSSKEVGNVDDGEEGANTGGGAENTGELQFGLVDETQEGDPPAQE